jgi:hypothetical protein
VVLLLVVVHNGIQTSSVGGMIYFLEKVNDDELVMLKWYHDDTAEEEIHQVTERDIDVAKLFHIYDTEEGSSSSQMTIFERSMVVQFSEKNHDHTKSR